MAEPKEISVEDAHEEGVYGTIHDPLENDAYTVSGQGEETAKREREAREELRGRWFNAGKGEDAGESSSGGQEQPQAAQEQPQAAAKPRRSSSSSSSSEAPPA